MAIPKQNFEFNQLLHQVVVRVQSCWRAAQLFVLSASRAGLQRHALDLAWILGVHDRHDWQQQMPAAPVQHYNTSLGADHSAVLVSSLPTAPARPTAEGKMHPLNECALAGSNAAGSIEHRTQHACHHSDEDTKVPQVR